MNSKLKQVQTQTQILSPAQRQSLHFLQLNLPDLRAELNKEMAQNPVIEEIEPSLEKVSTSAIEDESERIENARAGDYREEDDIAQTIYTADEEAIERRQKFFDSQTSEETLQEHLLSQLEMNDFSPQDRPILELLIGELNEDGYFTGSLPDIVMVSGESEKKLIALLKNLMRLDPLGCGARTLNECLLAQIEQLDNSPYQEEVKEILEKNYLSHIASGNWSVVTRELKISKERYSDVLLALRTLDPRPGRAFVSLTKSNAFVNPEVHAIKVGDNWRASVDERSLPEIRISKRYIQMLQDKGVSQEVKSYVKERIAAANAIREAVERRQETIASIAQAIIDAQPQFFSEGLKGLRPLTMQAIAEKVGLHPTTVSRTVRDKYISTPKGNVELRKFFVQTIKTNNGEEVMAQDVLEKIKELISKENKSAPLTDDKLADVLKAEGFPIARRTVAKYRANLGLPSATDRKQR